MGKMIMGVAAVSLDGFIADDNDEVGPLFDWLGSGDVGWSLPGGDDEARSTRASADFMTSHYANTAANVIGRRLFELTNGWDGKPAAYEHVFVVTHQPPTDWEHSGTAPFTFVDGVEEAIAAAKEFAGDRDVDVAGGQIGEQGTHARGPFAALAAKLRPALVIYGHQHRPHVSAAGQPALVGLGSFRDGQSSAVVLDSDETGRLVGALRRRPAI
jgi:dihydrofolate reductase